MPGKNREEGKTMEICSGSTNRIQGGGCPQEPISGLRATYNAYIEAKPAREAAAEQKLAEKITSVVIGLTDGGVYKACSRSCWSVCRRA